LHEWRNFVERCLRFNPTERFSSMAELIESLQLLLEKKPLQSKIRIPLSFGRLLSGKNSKGDITPCWLIDQKSN
jgi:hypothetical protein